MNDSLQHTRETELADNARVLALTLSTATSLLQIYDTAHLAVNRGDVRLRDAAELIQTYGSTLSYATKR